jgi:serine palmitoyltransferase
LERVLAKITKEQARKPLTRRFIITEGIFESYGDMVDLPKIVRDSSLPPALRIYGMI